jgi:hypothetical protein
MIGEISVLARVIAWGSETPRTASPDRFCVSDHQLRFKGLGLGFDLDS